MKTQPFLRFVLFRILPWAMLAFGDFAAAQAPEDPPARVASLSQIEGSVVFAPAGETEWIDATLNRPITRGDRLWTDKGARAEVHAGSAALHLDSQTFLDVVALDADVLQASLNEGSVNARVRLVQGGENFEIDTPQLAFRASQPGDYRIDVDPVQGTTRVTVRSGAALVYGANGQAQELDGGQVVTFSGRDLERVAVQATPVNDGFDRWAADRNRMEDQSVAARYVPREVVGYQQLDTHGSWDQDASYGAVWYPRVTVADWAPYRYGRWDFIQPWGWTWVDDAPWGFAPFHYGRWAQIGSRWAWVPGRMGPRPVYAPALVAFAGGGGVNFSLSIGSGPGIGWFPLGPGEAWRPAYRTSPVYVTNVNRYIINNRHAGGYIHQQRAGAWTTVRADDFSRGRPVNDHWQRANPAELGRAQVVAQPMLPQPQPNRFADNGRPARLRVVPPPQLAGPGFAGRPQPVFQNPGSGRREWNDGQRPIAVPRQQDTTPRAQVQGQPRWQERQPQQERQVQQERQAQQERVQRDQQVHVQRQQDEQRRQQQFQVQREQAQRQQQQAQQQQAQERAQRQQQQAAREYGVRQQHAAQEQMQRQQQMQQQQQQQQQRAVRQAPPQPQAAPEAQQQRRGEGRGGDGRGRGRGDQRDESRSNGDDGWRGRGHGGRAG